MSKEKISPSEFALELLDRFMHECYNKGYFLRMINNDMKEVEDLSSQIAYRALKNLDNEDFKAQIGIENTGDQRVPCMLSFAYGIHIGYMFVIEYDKFKSTDYSVDGLESKMFDAFNAMNVNILKDNISPIPFSDLFSLMLELYKISVLYMAEMGDIDDETRNDYVYAGVAAFYLMGANLSIYTLARQEEKWRNKDALHTEIN